ncbi:MAG: UMP kinase [Rickettsiales bacterium]|nr:UMP kinase [Rickettsiales bacterium]
MPDPATDIAPAPNYKRVLIKVSGEALMGDKAFGQDLQTIRKITEDIKQVTSMGVQVCIVVGGGNIFRGISGAAKGMDRSSADYMGMLATVMNALAMQNIMESEGIDTRVLSAMDIKEVAEPYIRRRAIRHMERGRVVIFAAGTGNPFFTTDTAAALRASEMNCDAIMKGTQVDGVYDKDPNKHDDAVRFDTLTYHDVLAKDLKVMDASAIALSRENNIPILVFSIHEDGAFADVVCGRGIHTIIKD